MQQIVATAGLAADARHSESAERLPANQRAGDATVHIQVANTELTLGAFQMCGLACVDATGEFVRGCIGNAERFVKVLGADHREHWTEDFLGGNARIGTHATDDGWSNKRHANLRLKSRRDRQGKLDFALLRAKFNIGTNLRGGFRVNHRANISSRLARIANHQCSCCFHQSVQEHIVRAVKHNHPTAC